MKLSMKEKVSYGIGAFGKDIVYMLVSSYLLIYYNTILGMDSAFIGVVLMAARVFDAFNDPFMGIIVAKTKSKWGRFRPWIISGTIMNAVVLYALFAVPESASMGTAKVWLTVVYLIWGITYTFMDIPYWSLIPAITEVGMERENMSAMARSCAGVGSAIPTVLTMIVVPILGGGAELMNRRIGFKWWALIIAIVFVVSELICVINVKEKNEGLLQSHDVKSMFKALFQNDQAVTVVVAIILINSSLYLTSNLVYYYFAYDIGNGTSAYSIFSAFGGASQILAMMLFPLFRKKFTKKKLFSIAGISEIIGYALMLLIAFTGITNVTESNQWGWMICLIPGFLVFLGSGLLNVLVTVFLSDSIDYGEYMTGRRDESIIFSMQTFVVKLASGLSALIAGLGIKLVGLNVTNGATAADQTQGSIFGLRLVMTVIPTIGILAAVIYFKKRYRLDEESLEAMIKRAKSN